MVFRYLTLPDILLTERYITNEGLLLWCFITSPLAEIHGPLNLTLIVRSCILNLNLTFSCLSSDIVSFSGLIPV